MNRTYFQRTCLLLVLMISTSVIYAADQTIALKHPEQLKALTEIKGTVQTLSPSSNKMVVKDSSNQQVEVIVTSNTAVTDTANHDFSWTALKPGDPVDVYYEPKTRTALQIDRKATIAESVLGIDHPEGK